MSNSTCSDLLSPALAGHAPPPLELAPYSDVVQLAALQLQALRGNFQPDVRIQSMLKEVAKFSLCHLGLMSRPRVSLCLHLS